MDFDVSSLIAHVEKRAAVGAMEIPGGHVALVPKDDGIALVSLKPFIDELRDAPERIAGKAETATLASFIALVKRHASGDSAIFGDFSVPALTAVVDYHTLDHKPKFARHRIRYGFPLSEEWKAWSAQNGKPMAQGEWAAFIEDRIADLASPTPEETALWLPIFKTDVAAPSDLVTLARGLSVAVEARVTEARVLQSGDSQLVFEENHKNAAGERLIVPGLFVVRAPLFEDAEPSRLLARLRYRVKEGRLTWFYQLYRADQALRDSLRAALAKAATETGLPAYEGSPEA